MKSKKMAGFKLLSANDIAATIFQFWSTLQLQQIAIAIALTAFSHKFFCGMRYTVKF